MGIEQTFFDLQKEDELRTYKLQIAGLRQAISCAVCPHCSENIADQDWVVDDNQNLVHIDCNDINDSLIETV